MSLTITTKESATQQATWVSKDRLATIMVTKGNFDHSQNKTGWSTYLSGPTEREGIGFGLTAVDDIKSPDNDDTPLKVLQTLTHFLDAWQEARDHGFGRASENWDLFPESVVGILSYVDEARQEVEEAQVIAENLVNGYEAGKAAGTWFWDASSLDQEEVRRVFRGFENGDPEIMDLCPCPWEYEGASSEKSRTDALGDYAEIEEVQSAYETAFDQGFWDEVQRAGKALLGSD